MYYLFYICIFQYLGIIIIFVVLHTIWVLLLLLLDTLLLFCRRIKECYYNYSYYLDICNLIRIT